MNKFYVALLFVLVADVLQAQSPGGVSTNLSLWLKADNSSTLSPTTGSLTSWTYSNNANQFTATVGSQPTVAPNTFNFLPSIAFNGSELMLGPTGPGAGGAPIPAGTLGYSIFAVWSSSIAAGSGAPNMRIWAQRPNNGTAGDANGDGAALWIFPAGQALAATSAPTYGDQPEISPFTTGVTSDPPAYFTSILTYSANTPYISELNLLPQDANDLELMDQTNYATGPGVGSTAPGGNATTVRILSDAGNFLGARSGAGDEGFIGNLAELIVYSGNVNALQRSAIFSYLSLKYGIPLNGSYVSSGGSTIWNSAANASYGLGSMNYDNFVFGLGQDNASGLLMTQSNSLSTGSGNGTGQSNMGNIVLANASALADQGFMLVGSNNAGFAETTTNMTPLATAGSERLANQWLIQNTGTVGAVDLSFDFSGITTTGTPGTSNEFRLVVDNDGDGDFTTGTATQTLYEPASWNGNVATFSQVTLTANSKVVISILSNAAAGTPLPVNWVNFTARANGADVDLNWTVSANENAKDYQVQHSVDGKTFTTIGDVSNQADVQSYGFVHANAGPGTHYYRVLETDRDGKSIYSKIVSVNMSASDFAIRLLNNPVQGNGVDAELEITAANSGNAALEIWTLSGTRVLTIMQDIQSGTSRIRLPMANLASGTYAVKIRVNDVTQVVQVVKL